MENLTLNKLKECFVKYLSKSIFVRYYNYLKTWRKHRDTIKQLNRLSDSELRDIGITRQQIEQLIWLEEDKKQSGSVL